MRHRRQRTLCPPRHRRTHRRKWYRNRRRPSSSPPPMTTTAFRKRSPASAHRAKRMPEATALTSRGFDHTLLAQSIAERIAQAVHACWQLHETLGNCVELRKMTCVNVYVCACVRACARAYVQTDGARGGRGERHVGPCRAAPWAVSAGGRQRTET
jgi:hypothetical protein